MAEHCAPLKDASWQHHVECGNAAGSDHEQEAVAEVIDIAELGLIYVRLGEVGSRIVVIVLLG